jgi:hypothetical protein
VEKLQRLDYSALPEDVQVEMRRLDAELRQQLRDLHAKFQRDLAIKLHNICNNIRL